VWRDRQVVLVIERDKDSRSGEKVGDNLFSTDGPVGALCQDAERQMVRRVTVSRGTLRPLLAADGTRVARCLNCGDGRENLSVTECETGAHACVLRLDAVFECETTHAHGVQPVFAKFESRNFHSQTHAQFARTIALTNARATACTILRAQVLSPGELPVSQVCFGSPKYVVRGSNSCDCASDKLHAARDWSVC